MKGKIIIGLMLIALTSLVSGYSLDVTVIDYNTLGVIENATVKVYNQSTLLQEGNTSDTGEIQFNLTTGNYTLVTTMIEYEGDNRDIEITGDTSELIQLIPFSREGIIRVTYNDLTLKGHELLIYYGLNNRLQGVYNHTQIITLSQHELYNIRLKPNIYDLTNQPEKMFHWTARFRPLIMFLLFSALIIGILIFVIYRTVKK